MRGVTYSQWLKTPKWLDLFTNKYAYGFYAGLSYFLTFGHTPYLIVTLIWAVMDGHKRLFLATHGDSDRPVPTYEAKEGYKFWVDIPAEFIFYLIKNKKPQTVADKKLFGVIWGTIQYSWKLYPTTTLLSLMAGNLWLALLCYPLAFLISMCYYLVGIINYNPKSISYAEIATGFIIFGYITGFTLWLI